MLNFVFVIPGFKLPSIKYQKFSTDLVYPGMFYKHLCSIWDLPSPLCQPNETYCTAGGCLLTLFAELCARAQACHQNRKKISLCYSFEARLRAAM